MAGDRFRTATAVEEIERDGDRIVYAAEIFDGWDIGGNANGGYLMAIAGRAMSDATGRPPLSLTGHYLRPAPPGPCSVAVEIVRSGRRFAVASATLTMDGTPIIRLLGTFGDQQDGGPSLVRGTPPDLPAFEDCPSRPDSGEAPGLMANLDLRIHPADTGFATGEPSGTPLIRGWFDLADDEPIDAIALLLAADAFAPPVFNTDMPVAWVPTVELTVHVRGVPAPGRLAGRFESRFVQNDLVDEDGELWDSSGALVAESRQISILPR